MPDIKNKVYGFLKKHGMDAESVDLDKNCRIFMEEMQRGLDGYASLLMLPTYIRMDKDILPMEPVVAVDAGGTNFRVAVIHFNKNNEPVIEDFRLHPMPGTNGEISKDEFFETVAGYILPLVHRSGKIGFCFSYPAEIMPDGDSRIIKFSKEVKVTGAVGEMLGKSLFKALEKLGCRDKKRIIVLNDTVATLLAGKAASPGRQFDSYIGYILGTGTNMCYAEECRNIGKISCLAGSDGLMLINVESGGYDKAPRGQIDLEFDSTTANPGEYVFEKAISGAYQGGLTLEVIRKACSDGVFSMAFSSEIASVSGLEAREVDEFLFYPYGSNKLAVCCNKSGLEEDRIALFYLIDNIFERIAKFVAFSLTAVLEKTGKGRNPCKPACITADGSTFYKSKLFRSKLEHYIKIYTNEEKGVYCEFVKVDNGTLIGAAIAGLLN
ncbi:MAG: hexokinase family protein [Bacillota bacterium]